MGNSQAISRGKAGYYLVEQILVGGFAGGEWQLGRLVLVIFKFNQMKTSIANNSKVVKLLIIKFLFGYLNN